MKKILALAVVAALALPCSALAQKKVNEYGEEDIFGPDLIEQAAPVEPAVKKSGKVEEYDVGSTAPKAKAKPAGESQTVVQPKKTTTALPLKSASVRGWSLKSVSAKSLA